MLRRLLLRRLQLPSEFGHDHRRVLRRPHAIRRRDERRERRQSATAPCSPRVGWTAGGGAAGELGNGRSAKAPSRGRRGCRRNRDTHRGDEPGRQRRELRLLAPCSPRAGWTAGGTARTASSATARSTRRSHGSATPVAVEGVGGTGTLTGVTSLVSEPGATAPCSPRAGWTAGATATTASSVTARSTRPAPYGSATPVAVEGVGGTGTLTGVTSLVERRLDGYCALLTSGGVDCWGYGDYGELGNGTFYTSSPYGSATPVAVEGVGGTGTLTGVTNLVSDSTTATAPCSPRAGWTAGGTATTASSATAPSTRVRKLRQRHSRGRRGSRRDRDAHRGDEPGRQATRLRLLRPAHLGRGGLLGGRSTAAR